MRGQLKSMGLSLDWAREFATCDPAYYKHQQRLFLDFLDAGLVDRKKSKVNWDPGRPHRAGQRAGDRRPRLALGRARRAARADAMVLPHQRLRRGPAEGARRAGEVAREGAPDAAQLDRPVGRTPVPLRPRPERRSGFETTSKCLHDAARHDVRRRPLRRSRPITRWPGRARRTQSGPSQAFIEECQRPGTSESGARDGGKTRARHGHRGDASGRSVAGAAALHRQFHADGLRLRRHLRLPGPRPARPRFRPRQDGLPVLDVFLPLDSDMPVTDVAFVPPQGTGGPLRPLARRAGHRAVAARRPWN